MSVFQPLRDEHRELWGSVERLREIADHADAVPVETLRHELEHAHAFLVHQLVAHAHAEDAVLYPAVAAVMGAYRATATMSRDHLEVKRFIEALGEWRTRLGAGTPDPEQLRTLRQLLYGLYALLKVHFAKEEEIYVPLLEANLDAAAAARLLDAMEAVAHHVQEGAGHP